MKKLISLLMALSIPFCTIAYADDEAVAVEEEQIVFTDTTYHWARAEIQALADEKIVSGNGEGKFLPDNKISRAEFSSMICKLIGTDKVAYTDLTDVAYGTWYYDIARTMVNRGYINCDDKVFNPDGEMTMRDAMAVFYRICSEKKNDITVEDTDAVVTTLRIDEPMTDWEKEAFAYTSKNELLYKFYGVADYELSRGMTRAEAAVLVSRLKTHLGLSVEPVTEEVVQ